MRIGTAALRPPWTSESELRDACTRCGICREACPMGVIDLDAEGLPQLSFAYNGCSLCGRCALACPEDLFDAERPALAWVAAVDGPCLTYPAATCDGCVKACLSGAIRLIESSGGIRLATIDAVRCNGCGACIAVCPTDAIGLKRLT